MSLSGRDWALQRATQRWGLVQLRLLVQAAANEQVPLAALRCELASEGLARLGGTIERSSGRRVAASPAAAIREENTLFVQHPGSSRSDSRAGATGARAAPPFMRHGPRHRREDPGRATCAGRGHSRVDRSPWQPAPLPRPAPRSNSRSPFKRARRARPRPCSSCSSWGPSRCSPPSARAPRQRTHAPLRTRRSTSSGSCAAGALATPFWGTDARVAPLAVKRAPGDPCSAPDDGARSRVPR